MAEKQGLEALKERSAAALRQRDLVGLAVSTAKYKTPTKAYTTVLAHGWPARLAKSVQSLAMLRRDYGLEAFDAFVSSFEHARSLVGETEHAQEKRMQREARLRAIAHLTSPAAKLGLMVKHGLTDDASALVRELLAEGEVSFWHNSNSATHPNPCLRDEKATGKNQDRRHSATETVYVLLCKKGVHPRANDQNPTAPERETDSTVTVVLDELAAALNWSESAKLQFIRQALEAIAARKVVYSHRDCINATRHVRQQYLAADDELGRRIDLIVFRTQFRQDRIYYTIHLYVPDPDRHTSSTVTVEKIDKLVDVFLSFGLNFAEIEDEFCWWLKNLPGTWPEWILALASAKCFMPNSEKRYQSLRHYLPKVWKYALDNPHDDWNLGHVESLGKVGLYRRTTTTQQGDESFFRTTFVELLSVGRVGQVFDVLIKLGDVAGLNPGSSWQENGGKSAARDCLELLAPDAFNAAFAAKRFGIAAALARQLNCFPAGTRNRKAEMIELATQLGQPIELVETFSLKKALAA